MRYLDILFSKSNIDENLGSQLQAIVYLVVSSAVNQGVSLSTLILPELNHSDALK